MTANPDLRNKRPRHSALANPENERQTAIYVTEMALELRDLARQSNLRFIAYLLEMVFVEAHSVAYKSPPDPYSLLRRRKTVA
jgi:hypothetical protein